MVDINATCDFTTGQLLYLLSAGLRRFRTRQAIRRTDKVEVAISVVILPTQLNVIQH